MIYVTPTPKEGNKGQLYLCNIFFDTWRWGHLMSIGVDDTCEETKIWKLMKLTWKMNIREPNFISGNAILVETGCIRVPKTQQYTH